MIWVVLATGVVATTEPVGEIKDPVWRARPTSQQYGAAYPMDAARNEKIGRAVVRCTADAQGELQACTLVCESPKGWQFGKAALGLTRRFKLEARLADGRSVEGGTVTMPFNFNPPFLLPLKQCEPASGRRLENHQRGPSAPSTASWSPPP